MKNPFLQLAIPFSSQLFDHFFVSIRIAADSKSFIIVISDTSVPIIIFFGVVVDIAAGIAVGIADDVVVVVAVAAV